MQFVASGKLSITARLLCGAISKTLAKLAFAYSWSSQDGNLRGKVGGIRAVVAAAERTAPTFHHRLTERQCSTSHSARSTEPGSNRNCTSTCCRGHS